MRAAGGGYAAAAMRAAGSPIVRRAGRTSIDT
jgi:hypothetical protein